jgi:hypothetical protein
MIYKPAKALGLAVGLVVLVTILGIEGFMLSSIGRQSVGVGMAITLLLLLFSLGLLGLWLYWCYELLALRYSLDRNALFIEYGTARHIVPLNEVKRVVAGDDDALRATTTFRGVGWPGYLKGRQRVPGLGWVLIHSTEPLERMVVIVTDAVSYGISPADQKAFLEALRVRQELGVLHPAEQTHLHSPLLSLPLWRDRFFWAAVVLAVLVDLGILSVMMARYGDLGLRIPLTLSIWGQAERIASRIWVLVLPVLGLGLVGLDTVVGMVVHERERLAAHLLVVAGLVTQVVLYFALCQVVLWG